MDAWWVIRNESEGGGVGPSAIRPISKRSWRDASWMKLKMVSLMNVGTARKQRGLVGDNMMRVVSRTMFGWIPTPGRRGFFFI